MAMNPEARHSFGDWSLTRASLERLDDAGMRVSHSAEEHPDDRHHVAIEVKKGREAEFEERMASGRLTVMNRHTRSYLGSSFLRDQAHSSRSIVIEYWSEMLVYEQDRAARSLAITSLETRRTTLVDSVEPLGVFTALDVPDRTGPAWSQRR
jgi:hypothetical protein